MISASVTVLEGSGSNSLWLSHRLKIIANIQHYPVCIVVSGVLTIVLESEHTTVNQLLNTHVGFLLDKKDPGGSMS